MTIKLTPEQEEIVRAGLKSGEFRTPEEAVSEAFDALREKVGAPANRADNGARREAVREMLAFVERNHVRLEDVSVKELIHEGHRPWATWCWTSP